MEEPIPEWRTPDKRDVRVLWKEHHLLETAMAGRKAAIWTWKKSHEPVLGLPIASRTARLLNRGPFLDTAKAKKHYLHQAPRAFSRYVKTFQCQKYTYQVHTWKSGVPLTTKCTFHALHLTIFSQHIFLEPCTNSSFTIMAVQRV